MTTQPQPDFYLRRSSSFVVTGPTSLPCLQRNYVARHLEFSCALRELWCIGDGIIRGIYNRKRKQERTRKVIRDPLILQIVNDLRRFIRFEMLIISLEGLIIEQVSELFEPDEMPFFIDGVSEPLMLKDIYSSRHYWESYANQPFLLTDIYAKRHYWEGQMHEALLDYSFDMKEADILIILSFLNNQDAMFYKMWAFVEEYNGQDRLKWKQRICRSLKNSMGQSERLKRRLLMELDKFLENDSF